VRVRERSDIISLHQRMLAQLRQRNSAELAALMNELLDYLLQKFEQATTAQAQKSV
jgi:DNA-binding GntR family transcriptional regulator